MTVSSHVSVVMNDQPQLSPDLRPIRHCPHCGARVAQRAETCFMCGGSLVPAKKRRIALPISDLLLVGVVLIIAFLWWTRSSNTVDESPAAVSNATVPAAGAVPTQAPASAQAVAVTATTEISSAVALTTTADLTPTATPTPVIYTVVRGDTVEKIAAAFGITARDLMSANGLSSDLIQVDQKLTIPTGPVELGPDGKPLPTVTPTPKNAIYLVVVRAGDTIDLIAKRLGSSVEAVVRANDKLESADTIIRPGDQLIVPVGTVTGTLSLQFAEPPTATPVPTPTPTPGPRWPAPFLLSPQDEQTFTGGSVLLQWLTVGTLDPNEVYFVRVVPDAPTQEQLAEVTTGTSLRVSEEWLQRLSRRTNRFTWSVQVARDVRSLGSGQTATFVAVSPSSPLRSFVWEADN